MDNFKQEVAASIAKIAPPTGVSMWLTIGGHIDDWIKLATLLYIIVQCTAVVLTKYLQWTGRLRPRKEGEDELEL